MTSQAQALMDVVRGLVAMVQARKEDGDLTSGIVVSALQ